MISPIKDSTKKNNSSNALKHIISKGTIVDTYAFYSGKVEFDLAAHEVFVNAHTISSPIYLFWECLRRDPRRLFQIVTSPSFAKYLDDNDMFKALQQMWHTHHSPYITASMFFILNRCSQHGLISSGELAVENYTPLSRSHLRGFKFPDNFHLTLESEDPLKSMREETTADYTIIPAGRFNYNLFEYGKNIGIEETPINHRELAVVMKESPRKIIALYDFHNAIPTAFKGNQITLVDQHGNPTESRQAAEEVIVANF